MPSTPSSVVNFTRLAWRIDVKPRAIPYARPLGRRYISGMISSLAIVGTAAPNFKPLPNYLRVALFSLSRQTSRWTAEYWNLSGRRPSCGPADKVRAGDQSPLNRLGSPSRLRLSPLPHASEGRDSFSLHAA